MDQTQILKLIQLEPADRQWVHEFITLQWGSPEIVVHGSVYLPENLEGCKAMADGEITGLITWSISGSKCEIVTLNSTRRGMGIGTTLLQACENIARNNGCEICWLVTTNDNLNAIQFYRERGYRITAISRGAVDEARRIKPAIPLYGENGIPIHDEITLSRKFRD
jgi:GNAT superfamily N-acetyltransferase